MDRAIREYLPEFTSITDHLSELSGMLIDRTTTLDFPRPMPPSFVYILGAGLSNVPNPKPMSEVRVKSPKSKPERLVDS